MKKESRPTSPDGERLPHRIRPPLRPARADQRQPLRCAVGGDEDKGGAELQTEVEDVRDSLLVHEDQTAVAGAKDLSCTFQGLLLVRPAKMFD